MFFKHYLPHISGKILSVKRLLSVFFHKKYENKQEKTSFNEKYEIVLHTLHFNAQSPLALVK